MPVIIGASTPSTVGPSPTPTGTSSAPPGSQPGSSQPGSSQPGTSPSGTPSSSPPGGTVSPTVSPAPGSNTCTQQPACYPDYRWLIDGLYQGVPGAISRADWIATFAKGTAFDNNIAKFLPATKPASAAGASPAIILTCAYPSLYLIRVDSYVAGRSQPTSMLWMTASPPPTVPPFGPTPVPITGIPTAGTGAPGGGGSSNTQTWPAPSGAPGPSPTPSPPSQTPPSNP